MKVGSLFTGIGGFDLGFERAGFELAWSAEIDKAASGVLAKHWPGVWNYGDVKAVMDGVPAVDVICGGFPCQDLSVAGHRAGLAGERSGLWFEFHRVLRELRPRYCVIENVPGLLSSNGGADFAVILRGLVELGYRVSWRALDAQYFGLAQRRKRVFIVGSLGDGRSAEVLFEREGVRGHPPSRGEAGQGTSRDLAPSLAASGRGTARAGESRGQDPLIISGRGREDGLSDEIEEGLSPALRAGNGGSSRAQIVFDPNAASGLAENQRGELRTSAISAQLTSGGGKPGQGYGAVYMPHVALTQAVSGGVRRLTPTECLRLQGFPDSWHEIQWSHANADEADAIEILRSLWRSTHTWTREGWGLRKPPTLLTPEVLLAGVHGGWLSWAVARECATRAREVQGQDAWPEGFMRRLQEVAEHRPSPYRRESFEQLARELGRLLSQLPLTEAQASKAVLHPGLWAKASAEWPVRYARPTQEARHPLADTHRYKQLGNAVAVPVAEWIARRIAEVER